MFNPFSPHGPYCRCAACSNDPRVHYEYFKKRDAERMANVNIDKAHGGLPQHVDLVQPFPGVSGADQVRVSFDGDILGGTTHVKKKKMHWEL